MTRVEGSHERAYRRLLRLYPAAFRTRFGDLMVQMFSDQLRDARDRRALAGVAGTWFRALWDLAVTAPSERAAARSVAHSLTSPPSMASRALGILGILGGLLLIVVFAVEISPELNFLRLVLVNVGAIAIVVAVTERQAMVARGLSFAAAVPAIVANAWYLGIDLLSIGRPVYPEPDPEFRPIFFYAGVALWITDAAFGAVSLRLGVVWRWAALALTVGSLLAFSGMGGLGLSTGSLGWIVGPLSLVGIALNGIGWIALGVDVAFRRRAPDPQAQRVQPED